MPGRLEGKCIFLTGAAQGIGFAIAQAAVAEGAQLFLADRDAKMLDEACKNLRKSGATIAQAVVDITDAAGIAAAVASAKLAMGTVNALINNAGVNVFCDPLAMTDAQWDRCFEINLKGAWNCCKAVLPDMIADGGGAILNIASTHSFTIIPGTFPYPLAKHALLGMTRSLALEYASHGVRVNALAPGYVRTQKVVEYWNTFPDAKEAEAKTNAIHPGKRIAEPEEIAKAAVFMISDECRFMNAACLVVDGGLSVLQHPA